MVTKTFRSSTHWFTGLTFWGTIVLVLAVLPFELQSNSGWVSKMGLATLCLAIVGLLLWVWFRTYYRLSGPFLHYRSGPIHGKIAVDQIREIHVNEYLWVGLRPALGLKGLVVYYNRWDEIYFSPEEKEQFVQALLELNPKIEVK